MADSDSDSGSSTASASAMLVVRPASRPNRPRFERCYTRRLLVSLSRSPLVACPRGLKPLSEWYGDYEGPSGGGGAGPAGNERANGARGAGRSGPGQQHQQQHDREKSGGANWVERERRDRNGDRNGGLGQNSAAGASVTGAMGDFRLAGAKNYGTPHVKDDNRRNAASSYERDALGAGAARERERERGDDRWNTLTAGRLDPADRRKATGDFVKKDGRAAEEGGWRSSREMRDGYRDRDRNGRGDRFQGTSSLQVDREGNRDRRRQPAWMEEDSRPLSGRRTDDNLPAWAAEEPSAPFSATLAPHDERDQANIRQHGETDRRSSAHQPASSSKGDSQSQHVDSIQAWKAEMKELERRKKADEERAIRKEMGLPDKSDEAGRLEPAQQAEPSPSANVQPTKGTSKSVFSDFLLSGPSDKGASTEAEKPRSSRFAKIFGASAQPGQAQAPLPEASQGQSAPSQSANNLLAALMPGGPSPAASSAPKSVSPSISGAAPSHADTQSMMRLMEMLHMSSASPASSASANRPSQTMSPDPVSSSRHGPPFERLGHDNQRPQQRQYINEPSEPVKDRRVASEVAFEQPLPSSGRRPAGLDFYDPAVISQAKQPQRNHSQEIFQQQATSYSSSGRPTYAEGGNYAQSTANPPTQAAHDNGSFFELQQQPHSRLSKRSSIPPPGRGADQGMLPDDPAIQQPWPQRSGPLSPQSDLHTQQAFLRTLEQRPESTGDTTAQQHHHQHRLNALLSGASANVQVPREQYERRGELASPGHAKPTTLPPGLQSDANFSKQPSLGLPHQGFPPHTSNLPMPPPTSSAGHHHQQQQPSSGNPIPLHYMQSPPPLPPHYLQQQHSGAPIPLPHFPPPHLGGNQQFPHSVPPPPGFYPGNLNNNTNIGSGGASQNHQHNALAQLLAGPHPGMAPMSANHALPPRPAQQGQQQPQQMQQNQIDLMALLTGASRR